jgi:hypothetical protein
MREAAEHNNPIAYICQRREARGQLELIAHGSGDPRSMDDAVWVIHEAEPARRLGGRRQRTHGRHHGVQKWEAERNAHATQKSPSG